MIVLTLSEVTANQSSGASPCRIPPTMDPSCWDYVRVLRLRGFMEKKKKVAGKVRLAVCGMYCTVDWEEAADKIRGR